VLAQAKQLADFLETPLWDANSYGAWTFQSKLDTAIMNMQRWFQSFWQRLARGPHDA
jgi:hypothetical protein